MSDSNNFPFNSGQKEKRCKSKESVKLIEEAACLPGVRSTFNPIGESRHAVHHIKVIQIAYLGTVLGGNSVFHFPKS